MFILVDRHGVSGEGLEGMSDSESMLCGNRFYHDFERLVHTGYGMGGAYSRKCGDQYADVSDGSVF